METPETAGHVPAFSSSGSPDIRLYDRHSIDQAPALEPLLREMVRNGPAHYIDNAPVEMLVVAVDGQSFPLVLAQPAGSHAEACSPYAHYIRYTEEEIIKRRPAVPAGLFKLLFWLWSQLARQAWLDRVVYFNNWLLSTNPPFELSHDQLQALTACLLKHYPDRAIVIRSLNQKQDMTNVAALQGLGYEAFPARTVNLLEPVGEQRKRWKRNLRIDVKLLENSDLEAGGFDPSAAHEPARTHQLYEGLYISKHSRINQQYNQHFFELSLDSGFFDAQVLRRDGQMKAFVLKHVHGERMLAQTIGYDRSAPANDNLYRQMIAALILSANQKASTLNLSAGIDAFKQHRGAIPYLEWDLVYRRHLPRRYRLAWQMVRLQGLAWAGRQQGAAAQTGAGGWEQSGAAVAGDRRQALWRRCSDAVYLQLLRQRIKPAGGVLLKTDLWDEATSSGLLDELKAWADRVVGMDIAQSTLQRARQHRRAAQLMQADVLALPLRDGSINCVVSNSTLDHFAQVAELKQGLAELVRTLAPGGQLFITLDNPANPLVWLRNHLPLRWLLRLGLVPYYVGATLSSKGLRAVLEQAGLSVVYSGYSVHAPRVLMVAIAALLQRWSPPLWQRGFLNLQLKCECLARWPTAAFTGHYVVVVARREH